MKTSLRTLTNSTSLAITLALFAATPANATKSSPGSGEIAIYTEATGGDVIAQNGSLAGGFLAHDFDTDDRQDGGSFTQNGANITLNRAGHYLAIYNSQFNGAPQAGTEERVEIQSYLTLGGTEQPTGWSQGFIRRQENQLDAVTAGIAIIEAVASDVLQLRSFRTDTTTVGTVTRVGNATGLQLVKLDDINMSYARLSLAANQAGPTTNGAPVQVLYDSTDELDPGFSYADGSGDLILADAGKYLVVANTYINAPNNRIGFVQQLTLDGAPISGTRTNIYLRGSQSTEEGAAGIGIIIETTAANQVLRVTGELDGGNLASSNYIAGRTGLAVVKLPDSASGTAPADPDFIRLTHNANQDVNTATDTDLIFDTQDEVDPEFTHSVGTSGISVATGGDYLFLGSFYGADDTTPRALINPGWSINDAARLTIGQSGRYTRNTGPPEFGNTLGLVASALATNDKVEMVSRGLGRIGANNTNPVALQAVRLESLFTRVAGFEVIIEPTAVAVTEGGATATYEMSIGLDPTSGSIDITVTSDADTEVSLDGTTYTPTVTPSFTAGLVPQTIHVRAFDDGEIEGPEPAATITHAITATADAVNYPTSLAIADVTVTITDNDVVPVTAVDDASTTNAIANAVATEALLAPQTDLLANDTDGLNNVVSASDSTSAEGAAVSVAADGTFTYDPISSPSLQALPAGGSLADTFSYTAKDAVDNTDSATVTITVDGLNDAPEAMPDVLNDGPLASDSSFVSTRDLTQNDGSYRNNLVPITYPPGSNLRTFPGIIASQSPSAGAPPGGGVPTNALDGNFGNFTHTDANQSVDHTWQVDFGQDVSLESAEVFNRSSCCGLRLRDITVTVLDSGGGTVFTSAVLNPNNVLGFTTGGSTASLFVDFGGPITGRTLVVTRTPDPGDADVSNGSVLSIGEITIIGSVPGYSLDIDELLLNYDAGNSAGTGRWENIGTSGGSNADWVLTGVTLDPAPVTARTGISAAYEWDSIADRAVFPGTGTNLGIQENLSGTEDTEDATWEFWVKPANTTQIMTLFETGGGTGFGCIIDNGVLEAATEFDGPGKTGSYVSYNLVTDPLGLVGGDPTTEFNQYAVTITVNGGLQLYVNGVKVDETTSGTGGDWCGGDGAGLGRFAGVNHGGYQGGANGMTYDAPFIGQMAIVRLYTGVRTAPQIYQNFNAVNTGTDIDGDAITATGVLDGTGTFVPIGTEATLASGALVTMTDATGGFDYNPNGVFSPPAGQPATDTFTYRVTDPSGLTAEATVTLLIIVPTIQEDWRILYYGYFANSGPGADSAMAVNGLTNLHSFTCDLDPTAPAGVLDIDAEAGTILSLGPPSIWTDPVTGRIYLRHTRRADYASIPLTITDEFSRNPGLPFEASAVPQTVIATGTGDSGAAIEAVQTEFPLVLPISGGKGRYGRVDVTTP